MSKIGKKNTEMNVGYNDIFKVEENLKKRARVNLESNELSSDSFIFEGIRNARKLQSREKVYQIDLTKLLQEENNQQGGAKHIEKTLPKN